MVVDEEETNEGEEIPEACYEIFQTLLPLTAAAAYYNLPKLCHKTHVCLSSYMECFSKLSYAMAEAWVQQEAAIPEVMALQALLNIRHFLSLDLNCHGVEMLSPSGLELVISNDKVIMTERHRFRLIEMWSSIADDAEQHDVAKSLIKKCIKLYLMDPDFLSTKVTMSGLVTTEQLLEAYQDQAKRAKHEHNIAFDNNNLMWKTTKSYSFQAKEGDGWKGDALQCPVITENHSYQWTVHISHIPTTPNAHVWLGVMSSAAAAIPQFGLCGIRQQSWGIYGHNGQEWSSDTKGKLLGDNAKFGAGSSVVATLHLSPEEENNGSLSISVDGKPAVFILNDMCSKLNFIDGFVPTVSCFQATATIVSMIQL